MVTDHRLS